MKKKHSILINLPLLFFFFTLLIVPSISIQGATQGLILWYQQIVPTLLPAMVLTSILLRTNAFVLMLPLFSPILSPVFALSRFGCCALITGWLCGYPMGAKTANELYSLGHITRSEATYLLSFVNQPSPMFLLGFIRFQVLNNTFPAWKILFSVYGSAYIVSLFTRFRWNRTSLKHAQDHPKPTQKEPAFLSILEQAFAGSSSVLVMIGIYMMFFSILSLLIQTVLPPISTVVCSGILEMTSGISQCASLSISPAIRVRLVLCMASFGGGCTALQVRSAASEIPYSFLNYLGCKLLQAACTGIIATFISLV